MQILNCHDKSVWFHKFIRKRGVSKRTKKIYSDEDKIKYQDIFLLVAVFLINLMKKIDNIDIV